MITTEEYCTLATEFREICPKQREHAIAAHQFERDDVPLLGEWDRIQAQKLHDRIHELLPLLQEYEKARRG